MKVTVIEEHSSNYPNPIHFEKGDQLKLVEWDTDFEGWIPCRSVQDARK